MQCTRISLDRPSTALHVLRSIVSKHIKQRDACGNISYTQDVVLLIELVSRNDEEADRH